MPRRVNPDRSELTTARGRWDRLLGRVWPAYERSRRRDEQLRQLKAKSWERSERVRAILEHAERANAENGELIDEILDGGE